MKPREPLKAGKKGFTTDPGCPFNGVGLIYTTTEDILGKDVSSLLSHKNCPKQ
jgi:hypothetical protein